MGLKRWATSEFRFCFIYSPTPSHLFFFFWHFRRFSRLLKSFSSVVKVRHTTSCIAVLYFTNSGSGFHGVGIHRALRNRGLEQLLPLMKFIGQYIAKPRYTEILTDTLHIILGLWRFYSLVKKRKMLLLCLCEYLRLQTSMASWLVNTTSLMMLWPTSR